MTDEKIVALYFERSETAVFHTQQKYEKYCYRIAKNVLRNDEDAEECVNDTYVRAWQSIPPQKPQNLAAYLGRITRNLAINRYIKDHAQKRNPTTDRIFDEIGEAIPSCDAPVGDQTELKDAINGFVASLDKKTRIVFVRRYWYLSTVKAIAHDCGLSESNVKAILMRTRQNFRTYLEKEGIAL